MRIVTHYNDTYDFRLYVAVDVPNSQALTRACRRNGTLKPDSAFTGPDPGVSASMYEGEYGDVLIVLWKGQGITISTIAHEAHHVAGYVCENRGIPYERRCDEASAYVLGWVVRKVLDTIGYSDLLP